MYSSMGRPNSFMPRVSLKLNCQSHIGSRLPCRVAQMSQILPKTVIPKTNVSKLGSGILSITKKAAIPAGTIKINNKLIR